MLSIIICSRNQAISNDLSENIKNTVGCEYELIVIDNSENKYSIFEAYNLGIDKSSGDYLCFIHDDILFHTQNWGKVVQRIFDQDQQIGLIGIAGAKSKTKMPSLWWSCPKEDKVATIIQHIPGRAVERWNPGKSEKAITKVVAVDGVFMGTRKDNRILFHSGVSGFHNYDLNLSFEYKKYGYEIVVVNEILIEHFSLGNIREDWFESSYELFKFYEKHLPLNLDNNKTNKQQEIRNAIWFITECLKLKKYKIAFSIWIKLFSLKPFLIFHLKYWKNNLKNNLHLISFKTNKT